MAKSGVDLLFGTDDEPEMTVDQGPSGTDLLFGDQPQAAPVDLNQTPGRFSPGVFSRAGMDFQQARQLIDEMAPAQRPAAEEQYARQYVAREREAAQSTPMGRLTQMATDWVRGAAQNVPGVGEFAGELNAQTAAALGGDYNLALRAERERRRLADAEDTGGIETGLGKVSPLDVAKGVGLVGGALAAPYTMAARAPVAAGALWGGLYGAAETAGRAEEDRDPNKALPTQEEYTSAAQAGAGPGALLGGVGGRVAQAINAKLARPDRYIPGQRVTGEELRNTARNAYRVAANSPIVFSPEGSRQLTQGVRRAVNDAGWLPESHPQVTTLLRTLDRVQDTATGGYTPVTAQYVGDITRSLNKAYRRADDDTRRVLDAARNSINDFVRTSGQRGLVQQGTADDLNRLITADTAARQAWSTFQRVRPVERIYDKVIRQNQSSFYGGNEYNMMKRGMNKLLDQEKLRRNLSPQTEAMIDRFINDRRGLDWLNRIGRATDPTSGSLLSGGLNVGNFVIGNWPVIAANIIVGGAMRRGSERAMRRNMERVLAAISSGQLRNEYSMVQRAMQGGLSEPQRAVAFQALIDKLAPYINMSREGAAESLEFLHNVGQTMGDQPLPSVDKITEQIIQTGVEDEPAR